MIKKITKDCLNHFKNNHFFRKTVILYVLTGCIIFFLFGIITTIIISGASMRQMNATEQKMLEQSCNTANLILRDIHSLANNKFSEDSAIREAMTEPYSVSISQNVQSSFTDIMSVSKLIDSVYVINLTNNIIYSTKTSAKNISSFFDEDILEYLSQNPAKSDIFFSRSVSLIFNSVDITHANYITSVYRNSKDYAFVVNIDQNAFQELVNLTSDRDSYVTAVLDSNGIVISHSNPEYFAKDMSENPLYKRVLASGLDSESFLHNGSIVNYVRSNTLGYTYLSISRVTNLLSSLVTQIVYMFLFSILLVLVYFICSMFASLNTYALYNNLKRNIYNLFNRSDSDAVTGDEIEHISRMLVEVKKRYSSMETIQYQYINTKQNATLKKLLLGVFSYLQDDMDSCSISFPYNGYAVVVCNIDNMSKMDTDTVYMIKYAIMNIGKEIFETHATTYVSEVNEYDVEFILNYMSDNSFIEDSVKKMNSYLKEFFQATASAAYDSNISASLEDISVLYHNAKYALPYRLVKGHTAIIAYSDVMELDNAISTYPEELEQKIIRSIPSQNDEELACSVNEFVRSLCHASFNMILLYIDRLLLAIDQFSIRSNMSDPADNMPENIQKIVSELETMDEIEHYILSKCRNLMLKFSNTKFDSKKDIMVKSVLDYIDQNYTDPNLSIDMIANEINRSANYTRGIFKQSQGISISDYIANKRFDEVCRLLIETNLTAQEIGAKLGLNSGSYFYTSFKKHTGYTPDQYRKLHHQADNN